MANYIAGVDLQRGVFQTLNGQISAAVYDEVPSSPQFPYVTISEVIEVADNTLNTFGRSTLLNIHIWSKYKGNKETFDILQEIITLLDKQSFSTSDKYNHVSTHYLDHQILKEPDTGIRHGIIRCRVFTQEK